ncbi:MAG TPA: ABC transporter permease [Streptosporangiaceae bacterium]|nr:ABC transporter permease [Streptosporangiaceae bacterium]
MSAIAIPRAGAAGLAPRWFALRAFGTEAGKGLRLMWRRRFMVVVAAAAFGLTYLGISLFIGGGHLVKDLMVRTVPALLAVAVANTAAVEGTGGIAEEINGGTLEQTRLSPASPQLQALGRMTALAVEGLAAAVVLGIVFVFGAGLGIVFVFGAGLGIHPHPAVVLPALLTIADALGYGLIMTALVVRVPGIGAITHVANMVIMAFGGMLVPVSVFPHGMEIFARFIPTALGVQSANTILAGHGLAAAWSDGTLPWLLAHTAVVVTAGLGLYVLNIRHAQREGGLSPR